VQEDAVDLVAFTGHKGLLGIQGLGGLWVREGLDVEPLLTGGTGGDSKLREMPPNYPDHLEAGTCCSAACTIRRSHCDHRTDRHGCADTGFAAGP
jgi:selenocysteine lyase/cysteine desulfurase